MICPRNLFPARGYNCKAPSCQPFSVLCIPCQDGPETDGDVSRQPPLRKKRISIEATDPEVRLPAGHDGEGWVALDGKRLIVKTRCGATRCGATRRGVTQCGATRCGATRCGATRCGVARCGVIRCGSTGCGSTRCGDGFIACEN